MSSIAALNAIFAYVPARSNHSQALVGASPRTRLMAEMSEQGVKAPKMTTHTRRTLEAKELEEETPRQTLTPHMITCNPFRVLDVTSTTIAPPTLEAAHWWLERNDTALPIKLNAHVVKGVVTVNGSSVLRNFLVGLDLHSANCVTAIVGLSDCRMVERVNVAHCRKLTDHSFLAGVPTLRHLNLSNSRHLASLDFLRTCPLLETLAVSECQGVEDWSPLALLPLLRRLAVRSSSLNSIAWAPCCPMLEELDVSNCERVADTKPLAGLRNLEVVLAQGSNVVDLDGLACCAHLERISVYDYQIAGVKACENKALLERSGTTVLVQ